MVEFQSGSASDDDLDWATFRWNFVDVACLKMFQFSVRFMSYNKIQGYGKRLGLLLLSRGTGLEEQLSTASVPYVRGG